MPLLERGCRVSGVLSSTTYRFGPSDRPNSAAPGTVVCPSKPPSSEKSPKGAARNLSAAALPSLSPTHSLTLSRTHSISCTLSRRRRLLLVCPPLCLTPHPRQPAPGVLET